MPAVLLSLVAICLAGLALIVASTPKAVDPRYEALIAKEISRQLEYRRRLALEAVLKTRLSKGKAS